MFVVEIGVVKWVCENLFLSWINIILILLLLYVVYVVLSGLLFWLFNSVWVVGLLSECCEIFVVIIYNIDGYSVGGCFVVIINCWF